MTILMPMMIPRRSFAIRDGHISFVINQVYVKRCIAIPGDSIGITNGIYRNNNYDSKLGDSLMQYRLANMLEADIDSSVFMKKHSNKHCSWTIKDMTSMYVTRKGDLIRLTQKEAYLYQCVLEWEIDKKISIDWDHNSVYADGKLAKLE